MSENTIKTVKIMTVRNSDALNDKVSMTIEEKNRTLGLIDSLSGANQAIVGIDKRHGRYITTTRDLTGAGIQSLEMIEGFQSAYRIEHEIVSYFRFVD